MKEACETNSFSVVVLGQSLNGSEKMRISGVVRTFCKTAKILELHAKIVPEFPGADGHLQVTASEPEGLIEAVSALLKPSRKAKTRPVS